MNRHRFGNYPQSNYGLTQFYIFIILIITRSVNFSIPGRTCPAQFLTAKRTLFCYCSSVICWIKTSDLLCAPDRSRTCNLRLRKPTFYPLNYKGKFVALRSPEPSASTRPERSSSESERIGLERSPAYDTPVVTERSSFDRKELCGISS